MKFGHRWDSNPCIRSAAVSEFRLYMPPTGKKLPQYPTAEDEVMMLQERVMEADRHAKLVSTTHI